LTIFSYFGKPSINLGYVESLTAFAQSGVGMQFLPQMKGRLLLDTASEKFMHADMRSTLESSGDNRGAKISPDEGDVVAYGS
jgi:hypothetical protein